MPFAELTLAAASRSLSKISQSNQLKTRMSRLSVLTSEHSIVPGTTGTRRILATCLLGGLLTVLHAAPALAGNEFAQSPVEKGVLLVASPTMDDPNFRQTVILVLEHGSEGTLGLVLNRSTNVLLSEALQIGRAHV